MNEISNNKQEKKEEDLTGIKAKLVMFAAIENMIKIEFGATLGNPQENMRNLVSSLEGKVQRKFGDTILRRARAGARHISRYGHRFYLKDTMRYLLISAFINFELEKIGKSKNTQEESKCLQSVGKAIANVLKNAPRKDKAKKEELEQIKEKYSKEFDNVAKRSFVLANSLENYKWCY